MFETGLVCNRNAPVVASVTASSPDAIATIKVNLTDENRDKIPIYLQDKPEFAVILEFKTATRLDTVNEAVEIHLDTHRFEELEFVDITTVDGPQRFKNLIRDYSHQCQVLQHSATFSVEYVLYVKASTKKNCI